MNKMKLELLAKCQKGTRKLTRDINGIQYCPFSDEQRIRCNHLLNELVFAPYRNGPNQNIKYKPFYVCNKRK